MAALVWQEIFHWALCASPFLFSLIGIIEALELYNFGYSKFADQSSLSPNVPSKLGMFILYFPSFLVMAAYLIIIRTEDVALAANVVAMLQLIHFLKRWLEVLFLHKFSGYMKLIDALIISVGYAALSLGNVIFSGYSLYEMPESKVTELLTWQVVASSVAVWLGPLVFTIGELGNLYHHWLLRLLRTAKMEKDSSAEKKYFVPHGGMFQMLTCPHYFFEVISFVGLAISSQAVFAFAIAFAALCYLLGRSVATRRWYRAHVPSFPTDRKLIVPWVL